MEGKVAVLGGADFVMPFAALGLDTFAAGETAEQMAQSARTIIERKYTLVVVAENVASKVQDVFAVTEKKAVPCVVVVPFTTESEGFATRALGEALKMATGVNILGNG